MKLDFCQLITEMAVGIELARLCGVFELVPSLAKSYRSIFSQKSPQFNQGYCLC